MLIELVQIIKTRNLMMIAIIGWKDVFTLDLDVQLRVLAMTIV